MAFNWDPIYGVNLILCIAIVLLGYWGYQKKKNPVSLYVGIAFGLFGISHLATLMGQRAALGDVLIIVRLVAYLLVVFALYQVGSRRK
jgi:uncharacterized membrane protein (UPF0136 family)